MIDAPTQPEQTPEATPAPVTPEAVAPTAPAPAAPTAPAATPQPVAQQAGPRYIWGTGRRKTSVARVRIRPGEGKFIINDRDINTYFSEEKDRNLVVNPLRMVGELGKMDVIVRVHGGGYSGQAGAIALGLGRALKSTDAAAYESTLRAGGMLTRDPRMVERKKYGQRGARRRFQFSKR